MKKTANRFEKRKEESRQKIVNAALALFSKKGVAETSIAAIILEADIAHKTFFNHFAGKEALLRYIVNEFTDDLENIVNETSQSDEHPAERLEKTLMGIAKVLDPVSDSSRELLHYYLASRDNSYNKADRSDDMLYRHIQRILNDARSQKVLIDGFSPTTLSSMVMGLLYSTLMFWSCNKEVSLQNDMRKTSRFAINSVFTP